MGGYTLGLDIGPNSVGWALVDREKEGVVGLGVRVFPEGVDRDTKGFEKSKNAGRREARGARRTRQRRTQRRRKLIRTLREAGLLPQRKEELGRLLEVEPYSLRAKGLDEELSLHEFGRVLYHIDQRRGFKSNRKSTKKGEEGQIAKEAGELQARIDAAGCRTLGGYFAGLEPEEERVRGHYTFRSMYEREFDELWKKQAGFYPEILKEDLRKTIRDEIIFYQRSLRPTEHLIGDCDLEPGEKRCPRADWYARRYRILQDVNNLRLILPDGSVHNLGSEQRKKILAELASKKEVRFSSLRKKLGLLESEQFNAEYEIDDKGKKREKLRGDEFAAVMRSRKVFGTKRWDGMSREAQIELDGLFGKLDDDDLMEVLLSDYGLTEDEAQAAMKVEQPRGYMSFSRKAVQKLLVVMEQGKGPDEAVREVYPERDIGGNMELVDRLDLPQDVRNPLVNRALFEVRKVVNAIVREHGRPAEIVVEMARDVKGNARERREEHWKIEANRKVNEEVRQRLQTDFGIVNPTWDDVVKYKLWVECGKVCPYTGRTISQTSLFGPNPEFQVEHILPYDRSLDDSFVNKSLCEGHENIRVKRNQTPHEAYSSDPERYEQIKERVNSSLMPYWKRQRFWQEEINTDDIIRRELNDTRYITREAVKYLKGICKNVRGSRGKVTSELGYQWGFMKDREDHRHHAIDAVVAAVTRNNHLRELGRTKYSSRGKGFAAPWPHFREEVLEKVKQINVSHRPTRKVSGALHEETNYGRTGLKDEKGQEYFVYRKKLVELTLPMVGKIIDRVVREIVEKRLSEKGIAIGTGERRIPKDVWQEPVYMKTTKSEKKVPIKKVRIREVLGNPKGMKDAVGRTYRYVKPGRNHHVEIWEYAEGEKKGRRDSEVVSMFEAVERSRRGEAAVKRDHGPGTKFICSLAMNDMVMMKNKRGETDLYRVQKMDANRMVRFRHHAAATIDKKETYVDKTAHLLEGYKVTVDRLGRICRAND